MSTIRPIPWPTRAIEAICLEAIPSHNAVTPTHPVMQNWQSPEAPD